MPGLILNPLQQQRALLAGKAIFHDARIGVLEVGGDDRLDWLHGVLSQNVKMLTPGQAVEALLLDPQGHIEYRLGVVATDATVLLLVAADLAQTLATWLGRMVFRSKVTVANRSDALAVVSTWGQALPEAVAVWNDPWPEVAPGGYRYGQAPTEPWQLSQNLVPVETLASLLAENDLVAESAFTALRIAAHRPAEAEIDEKSLPHELGWLATAVHLSKGCYRGQESVAKVHNLGHPPRRLVLLHLDGSEHELPEPGAAITVAGELDGQVRGRVTSVAQHHEAGPIALAVVSRALVVDANLLVATQGGLVSANQEVIIPPDAGKVANIPRKSLLGNRR